MTAALASLMLLLSGLVPDAVEGCTCSPASHCVSAAGGDVVFVGRVERTDRGMLRLRVLETFGGMDATVFDIAAGTSCDYPFRPGREYVVFARPRGSSLSVSRCSATREVRDAGPQLDYLRAVFRDKKPVGRISGQVNLLRPAVLGRRGSVQPASGITIVVVPAGGGTESRLVTDAAGYFTADGFPPGAYDIAMVLPPALAGSLEHSRVELKEPAGCTWTEGIVSYDGRVGGRVIDARGTPIQGLTVDLTVRRKAITPAPLERLQTVTDHEGSYRFERLVPGMYVVGLGLSGDAGIAPLFHPGTSAAGAATTVRLGAGEQRTLADFVVPVHLTTMAFYGIVLDADGLPSAGMSVYARTGDEGPIVGAGVLTDDAGHFRMTLF